MNKPAAKEPSMDEILSSIRQIIADDDAAVPTRRTEFAPVSPQPEPVAEEEDDEPLALMADQIVQEVEEAAAPMDEDRPVSPASLDKPSVGASSDPDIESLLATMNAMTASEQQDEAEPEPEQTQDAELVVPDDVTFEGMETVPSLRSADLDPEPSTLADDRPFPASRGLPPRQATPVAEAAPMPDAQLSSDIADQLLEPATGAAVRATMGRLAPLGLGAQGLTIETMVREMLRPMLKEWLDENLPAVVERLVEKEIARVSRGDL